MLETLTALPVAAFLSANVPVAELTFNTSPVTLPVKVADEVFNVAAVVASYTLLTPAIPVTPVMFALSTVSEPTTIKLLLKFTAFTVVTLLAPTL